MASTFSSWLLKSRYIALVLATGFAALAIAPAPASAQNGASVSDDAKDSKDTSLGPPTIPVDQIIQKFAAKEEEFKEERENFTYKQTVLVQTLDDDNRVDGEYLDKVDVDFTADGKRTEKGTYEPPSTLERVMLTDEDLHDFAQLYPFVLTTTELPDYNITYVDHRPLDELTTYIFDVAPKSIAKKQRFFQGRIWVDDKDFQIVKTYGKPVGYAKKKNGMAEQQFPHFETFRENIEGKYWFPTYSRADEMLHFGSGNDVHIRVKVRYEDYRRYRGSGRIISSQPEPQTQQPPPQPPAQTK